MPAAARAPSDEYMPIEPGTSPHAPLTERKGPPQPAALAVVRSGNSGKVRTVQAAAQPEASDLFERAERAAQRDRAGMRTQAADPIGSDSCPVCGHPDVPAGADGQRRCPQCGTSATLQGGRLSTPDRRGGDPLIGRSLRGCLIDRKVGEGGMGAVYHAKQLSLDRSVAIKVLPPDLARNKGFINRFEREAKSLARINHPNILQIYDFGDDAGLGVYFMVIEFVDGCDLGEILNRHLTVGQLEVLDLCRQAVQGLEQAAEKGVIHRDIKPDNLMITADGVVKVSDFGLAKGMGATTEVTSAGVRVGTPAFMSPEQCDGGEIDARSDIYNLGCTAFLALTGQLPFDGDTPFAIMLKHKSDPVPGLRNLNPAIDPRVEALILRLLAKRPDQRCSSLRALVDEIEDLMVSISGTASILRKTRGPMRAMRDGGSSASRKSVPAPPIAHPSGRRPAVVGAAPPAAPAKPAAVAASVDAIPEWLRPIDLPLPAAPASAEPAPVSPRATRSRLPVVNEPAGRSSRLAQAVTGDATRSTEPAMAAAAPMPSGRASSRLLPPGAAGRSSASGRLAPDAEAARRRGRNAEMADLIAAADRLAAAGQHAKAADDLERAAQIATVPEAAEQLRTRAASLRRRGVSRWRNRRGLVAFAIFLFLLANLWVWPPIIHNRLADRELGRILALPEGQPRREALSGFLAGPARPWSWYTLTFRRAYDIDAEDRAIASMPSADASLALAAERRRNAPMRRLELVRDDPRIAWSEVEDTAREVAASTTDAAVQNAAAALASQAREAIARMQADLDAMAALRKAGNHAAALAAGTRFAKEHPRAGRMAALAAAPLRLELRSAENAALAPSAVAIDGVIALDPRVLSRIPAAAAQVAIRATDHADETVAVPAGGDGVVHARLVAAARWRTAPAASSAPWTRIIVAGEALAVVRPDGFAAWNRATGERIPTATATGLTPSISIDGDALVLATQQGGRLRLAPGLASSVPAPGAGHALAAVTAELSYQPGRSASFQIEPAGDGRALVARSGNAVLWRVDGLAGALDPVVLRSGALLCLPDQQRLLAIDDLGHTVQDLPLAAPRSGGFAYLAGAGIIAMGTSRGLELVRISEAAQPLNRLDGDTFGEGPVAAVAASGDTLAVARSNGTVAVARWLGGGFSLRWKSQIATEPAALALDDRVLAIASASGAITLADAASGTTLRSFAGLGAAPAAMLVHDGTAHTAGADGTVAAWGAPAP